MSLPLLGMTLPSGLIIQFQLPSSIEAMKARSAWQRLGGETSGASVFHAYLAWGIKMVGSQSFSLERGDLWEPLSYIPMEQDTASVVSVVSFLMNATQEQVDGVLKSLRRLDTDTLIPAPVEETNNGAVAPSAEPVAAL